MSKRWGSECVEVQCPKCGWTVKQVLKETMLELRGREIFCLGCGSHFVIPDSAESCGMPQKPLSEAPNSPPDQGGDGSAPP